MSCVIGGDPSHRLEVAVVSVEGFGGDAGEFGGRVLECPLEGGVDAENLARHVGNKDCVRRTLEHALEQHALVTSFGFRGGKLGEKQLLTFLGLFAIRDVGDRADSADRLAGAADAFKLGLGTQGDPAHSFVGPDDTVFGAVNAIA